MLIKNLLANFIIVALSTEPDIVRLEQGLVRLRDWIRGKKEK